MTPAIELTKDNFREYLRACGLRNLEWYHHLCDKAGSARCIQLASITGGHLQFIIHPSLYEKGKWQVTTLTEIDGNPEFPIGHCCLPTREEALKSFAGMAGYWNNGRSYEYDIVQTVE